MSGVMAKAGSLFSAMKWLPCAIASGPAKGKAQQKGAPDSSGAPSYKPILD
jgi:hypothetical protein